MLLSELIELVLIESGQFILDGLEDMSLSKDRFYMLTRSQLSFYEKYRPYTWYDTIDFSNSHTFITLVDNPTLPQAEQKILKPIPKWISSAIPVSSFSVPSVGLVYKSLNMAPNSDSSISRPVNWIWKYEKPMLMAPFNGKLDVTMHSGYIQNVELSTSGSIKDVDFVGLDMDYDFVTMLTGAFLQAIGRSRRAFTLTDIPVQLDSDSLVSEGKEMVTEAKEMIKERANFHFAIGN